MMKKQEIKIQSKMKTRVFKQLLRTFSNNSNKYSLPQQSI